VIKIKKAQSAGEYLLILAIVILIALVVIFIFGGIK